MKISLTNDHIRNGRMKRGDACPIAIALKEQTGKDWFVTTLDAELLETARGNQCGLLVPLPDEAQRFARTFDTEGYLGVQPLTFDFPWVSSAQLKMEGFPNGDK